MIDYDDPNFDTLDAEYETMYSLVGYFIAQCLLIALWISFELSIVCKMEDPQAFHALTKEMDLKTKIQRLKKLCVRPRQKIGKKFDECLTFLHDNIATLRNFIAHIALFKPKDDPQRIYFSAVGNFPLKAFGFKGKSDNAKVITFDALKSYGDKHFQHFNHCSTHCTNHQ